MSPVVLDQALPPASAGGTRPPPPKPETLRHPEKAHRADAVSPPKPSWIRATAPDPRHLAETRDIVRRHGLHTVCEEAACPNIGECWAQRHATFLIMGETCTRGCAFCNVATGRPNRLDPLEPAKVARAVADLDLEHVVITSVDRDDLPDGGARHFAATIRALRRMAPRTSIEILTPDFLRKPESLDILAEAPPDVFNHNLETVPRLYPSVRPGARYYQSLRLLDDMKRRVPGIFTKSGLMVGLGETREEILQVMDDLRIAEVDFLTIGQYLQPTPKHWPIQRFVPPDEFSALAGVAQGKGFLLVAASPLTRSSHHAAADFRKLQAARISSPATIV